MRTLRVHPLCLCRPEGVETYVSVASNGFAIRRMPYTASQHHPKCAFSASPMMAPAHFLADRDFQSFKRHADDLGQLLRDLWRTAELNRWQPAFAGRRSWWTVRRHLLAAASAFQWQGVALKKQLYVPETFRSRMGEAIYERRRTHCLRMLNDPVCSGVIVVIGEVKRLDSNDDATSLVFKHVPDCGFKLTEYRYEWINELFRSQFALASSGDDLHLVAAVVASLTPTREPSILAFSSMVTTPEWLPVRNIPERAMLARWVSERRTFNVEDLGDVGRRRMVRGAYGTLCPSSAAR